MKSSRTLALIPFACALAVVPLLWAAQTPTPQSQPPPTPTPQSPPAQTPTPQPHPQKITGTTLWPASELKWQPVTGIEGAQQVPLWGDPTKGPHGIFYKFPAGTKVPLHTHTHGDRGVIISGAMSLAVGGAPGKKLPAGSFFSMAGGTEHITSIDAGEPCVFFIEREGPFDTILAEEPKSAPPKK